MIPTELLRGEIVPLNTRHEGDDSTPPDGCLGDAIIFGLIVLLVKGTWNLVGDFFDGKQSSGSESSTNKKK